MKNTGKVVKHIRRNLTATYCGIETAKLDPTTIKPAGHGTCQRCISAYENHIAQMRAARKAS